MTNPKTWTLSLSLWLVLGGCGGGGGGDGSFEYSAVADDSTVVSALTDEQAIDICSAMIEHYDAQLGEDALLRAACLAGSVSSATTEAECTAQIPGCEEELGARLDLAAACRRSITPVRSECTATIAEIELCIDDTTAMLAELLSGSCADAPTVSDVEGTRYYSGSPPSCLALDDACSQLLLQSGRP